MNRSRIDALIITAGFALLLMLTLTMVKIRVDDVDPDWPPRNHTDISMVEDFVEVVEMPSNYAVDDVAAAQTDVPATNESSTAPLSGPDVVDAGVEGPAPSTVTTKVEAPVQAKTTAETPDKGAVDPQAEAREEARRKASAATKNAFGNSKGSNNSQSTGVQAGESGRTDGTGIASSGYGSGDVTGGWRLPKYARVPSTVTGSIKLRLKIDREGRVTEVTFLGGNPPAATDASLRAACEREVRSHRFTRSDDNAPAQATATITYTFK